MTTMIVPRGLRTVPHRSLDRLAEHARDVAFPADAPIITEGAPADRFWIVRTGTVHLDLGFPRGLPGSAESIGPEELLGWSWLFPPYVWSVSAAAFSPVRAVEFDAAAVRGLCAEDPAFGQAVACYVAQVVAGRLQHARNRLADSWVRGGGTGVIG